MTAIADVIVVGGGAVGAACARELARSGRQVLVVERGTTEGEAWRAAAGMLAPLIEPERDHSLFELGVAGRERHAELAPELRDATGVDVGFWQDGILRVATDEAEAEALRSRVGVLRARSHPCDWLEADELRRRWPWLGRAPGGLWAPRDGALEPSRLVEALMADAEAHGARVARDRVMALEWTGSRVTGVAGRDRYAGGEVVLAAGAWSGQIDGLPRPVSVAPVRGQMVALPWPRGVPRTIVYRGDCYVVARGPEAIAGSTMEYVGFRPEVTAAGLKRILEHVGTLSAVFSASRPTRSWSGLRPMTPDGHPIIGRAPHADGLWYATGHGRNGILLSAITAVLLSRLMAGEPVPTDLGSVAPDRFWQW